MLISVNVTRNNQLEPAQEDAPSFATLFFAKESLTKTDRCPGALKEKSAIGSKFFMAFPFGPIPKVTKHVNLQLFIKSSNFCKLFQRIMGSR